jgi:hypothetical protein
VVWLVIIWLQDIHCMIKFMIIGWHICTYCYLIMLRNLIFFVCSVDNVHCLYHQKCHCYNYTTSKNNTIYNITFFKSILQQMHLHGSFNSTTVVVPFPNYTESTHVSCALNNNQDHGTIHDYCLNNISPNNSLEATLPEKESLMMVTDNIRLQGTKS